MKTIEEKDKIDKKTTSKTIVKKTKNPVNNSFESLLPKDSEIETVEKDFCLEDGSFIEIDLSLFE